MKSQNKIGFGVFCSYLLPLALLVAGCSFVQVPSEPTCKLRTYANSGLLDYLSTRNQGRAPVRLGIIPFEVPENFAQPGNDSLHFGKELASKFQLELSRAGEVDVVELFDQKRWPGKREDFRSGNYGAISRAHHAGYDLVMVGYLEDITNASMLHLNTKIIDTNNYVTVWHARTTVNSDARHKRAMLARFGIGQESPSQFDFPERTESMVVCTVKNIVSADPLEQGEDLYPGGGSKNVSPTAPSRRIREF